MLKNGEKKTLQLLHLIITTQCMSGFLTRTTMGMRNSITFVGVDLDGRFINFDLNGRFGVTHGGARDLLSHMQDVLVRLNLDVAHVVCNTQKGILVRFSICKISSLTL